MSIFLCFSPSVFLVGPVWIIVKVHVNVFIILLHPAFHFLALFSQQIGYYEIGQSP